VIGRLAVIVLILLFLISVSSNYGQALQKGPTASATIGTARQTEVSIAVVNNPIDRGDRQTIIVDVFDLQSKHGLVGVIIDGTVTYTSGLPLYEFKGKAGEAGHFSYSWTIDKDIEPGIFIVVISATSEQYSLRRVESTTFEAM
jgi:hypothetical protein